MVGGLGPSTSGVVVSATASARPVLTFRNFSLRCDKSDPTVSFQTPWNWSLTHGKRVAVITNNPFLRYQLTACLSGFVPSVSGEVISQGVIGWPVGGEGGLDRKLRIRHAVDFLSVLYGDCLQRSRVSIGEFWDLLSGVGVHSEVLVKELSRSQKDFFYLALSVLFSFDFYLFPDTRFLMSSAAGELRSLLLTQLEGKTLLSTSTSLQFQSEFCAEGLVLGALGQILFTGKLSKAIEWADQNLESSSFCDDDFEVTKILSNVESYGDQDDDFI